MDCAFGESGVSSYGVVSGDSFDACCCLVVVLSSLSMDLVLFGGKFVMKSASLVLCFFLLDLPAYTAFAFNMHERLVSFIKLPWTQ